MKDADDIRALMAEHRRAREGRGGRARLRRAGGRGPPLVAAAEAVDARRRTSSRPTPKDMDFGREKGLSPAMLDRLMLDDARIDGIVAGLRAVAAQDDPVGQVIAEWDMPSGLHIRRVRTPLGVDRRDLRKPPQRHRRCRRALPQVRATR